MHHDMPQSHTTTTTTTTTTNMTVTAFLPVVPLPLSPCLTSCRSPRRRPRPRTQPRPPPRPPTATTTTKSRQTESQPSIQFSSIPVLLGTNHRQEQLQRRTTYQTIFVTSSSAEYEQQQQQQQNVQSENDSKLPSSTETEQFGFNQQQDVPSTSAISPSQSPTTKEIQPAKPPPITSSSSKKILLTTPGSTARIYLDRARRETLHALNESDLFSQVRIPSRRETLTMAGEVAIVIAVLVLLRAGVSSVLRWVHMRLSTTSSKLSTSPFDFSSSSTMSSSSSSSDTSLIGNSSDSDSDTSSTTTNTSAIGNSSNNNSSSSSSSTSGANQNPSSTSSTSTSSLSSSSSSSSVATGTAGTSSSSSIPGFIPYEASVFECMQRPLEFLSVFTVGTALAEVVSRPLGTAGLLRHIRSLRELGLIISATWFLMRWIERIRSRFVNDKRIDKAQVDATARFVTVATFIVSLLISLDTLGVNVQAVLAFGGIGGVAIGFAGREIISNFFGGFMIYVTRPFTVGEWIRCIEETQLNGTVEDIGWYLTRVRTWDKRPLYIPNSRFSTLIVENGSRMDNRRIVHTIHLRLEDVPVVEKIVTQMEKILMTHPDLDPKQHRLCYVDSFDDYSIRLWFSCYTKSVFLYDFRDVQQELLLKFYQVIRQCGAQLASRNTRDVRPGIDTDRYGPLGIGSSQSDHHHYQQQQQQGIDHVQNGGSRRIDNIPYASVQQDEMDLIDREKEMEVATTHDGKNGHGVSEGNGQSQKVMYSDAEMINAVMNAFTGGGGGEDKSVNKTSDGSGSTNASSNGPTSVSTQASSSTPQESSNSTGSVVGQMKISGASSSSSSSSSSTSAAKSSTDNNNSDGTSSNNTSSQSNVVSSGQQQMKISGTATNKSSTWSNIVGVGADVKDDNNNSAKKKGSDDNSSNVNTSGQMKISAAKPMRGTAGGGNSGSSSNASSSPPSSKGSNNKNNNNSNKDNNPHEHEKDMGGKK